MDNYQPTQTAPALTFSQKVTGLLEKNPVIYQFMRFGCIGSLNTALNFLILNSVSKVLNISEGWPLGSVSALAFCGAVVQSYIWNRTWTFGQQQGLSLFQNFVRLVEVGLLGLLAVIFVFLGSGFSAPYIFYVGLLAAFLVSEFALWRYFGFKISNWGQQTQSFVIFFIITLIGLGINVTLISLISKNLHLTGTDLDKNIAAFMAVGVSLFWNFAGYKLIVFKK